MTSEATLTPVPGAEPRFDPETGKEIINVMTCGHCGRSWNDAASSALTPVPSGRCPFEYDHTEPATIPTVPDDHDTLLDLVVTYGAARWEAGYRLANGDTRMHQSIATANVALDQIATLITRLQRKAGGGL